MKSENLLRSPDHKLDKVLLQQYNDMLWKRMDLDWQLKPRRRWHKRVGWKASEYFEDPKVIELCNAIEADDVELMEADSQKAKSMEELLLSLTGKLSIRAKP